MGCPPVTSQPERTRSALVQLHLHTAMGVQPFLLLVTASAQPRLCCGTPDPAACVWRTVSMQVRCMLSCRGSLWLAGNSAPACLQPVHSCTGTDNQQSLVHCVFLCRGSLVPATACILRRSAATMSYTLMSSLPCLQAVAALVVSPVILVILATVERRSFVRSERRRLAAAAATKGGESVSSPPASMALARSAPPASLLKEHA